MRRAFQFLFLLFYVGSSYAVTQERTVLEADQVQHSASKSDQTLIDESCKHPADGYPSYRQAKPKAGSDFYFSRVESIHLLPHVSEQAFHPQTYSHKSLNTLETVLLRAPPVQL